MFRQSDVVPQSGATLCKPSRGHRNFAFKYTDSAPSDTGWRIWEANAFGDRTYYVSAKAICGN